MSVGGGRRTVKVLSRSVYPGPNLRAHFPVIRFAVVEILHLTDAGQDSHGNLGTDFL